MLLRNIVKLMRLVMWRRKSSEAQAQRRRPNTWQFELESNNFVVAQSSVRLRRRIRTLSRLERCCQRCEPRRQCCVASKFTRRDLRFRLLLLLWSCKQSLSQTLEQTGRRKQIAACKRKSAEVTQLQHVSGAR